MNNKHHIIAALVLASMAMGITSCSDDFLKEKKNYGNFNQTTAYSNYNGALERVNNLYYWMLPVSDGGDGNGTNQNWNWGTDTRGGWWDPATFTVSPVSGNWLGFENYTGWWDHNVQFNGKQAPKGIDASTPLPDLELRYEVYLPKIPSATCYSKITFMGAEVDKIAIADRITGQTTAGEWMSVAIPLTQFGTGTYGDLVGSAPGDDGNFKIYHDFESREGVWFAVAYDNFRIYKIK